MRRALSIIGWLLVAAAFGCAPDIPENGYGLEVVDDKITYLRTVEADHTKELVDVKTEIPRVGIDVRYATNDNFVGEPLYPTEKVLLREPAAEALAGVQGDLEGRGLGLKVFDGYHPYSVTERMWNIVRDPRYVADPAEGSRHNRGAAVDVTLVDKSGEELPMPTGYDDFTEKAHQDYMDLPADVVRNREILRRAMERHGFEAFLTEWWHYDYRGYERYEILDLPLGSVP